MCFVSTVVSPTRYPQQLHGPVPSLHHQYATSPEAAARRQLLLDESFPQQLQRADLHAPAAASQHGGMLMMPRHPYTASSVDACGMNMCDAAIYNSAEMQRSRVSHLHVLVRVHVVMYMYVYINM